MYMINIISGYVHIRSWLIIIIIIIMVEVELVDVEFDVSMHNSLFMQIRKMVHPHCVHVDDIAYLSIKGSNTMTKVKATDLKTFIAHRST